MAKRVIGIIDYNGQAHCMEHASTVNCYESEIHPTSPATECWCGEKLGGRKAPTPGVSQYVRMTDGIKGKRNAPSRLVRQRWGK